jgi:hypothetical protein
MRLREKLEWFLAGLALAGLAGGCCANSGVFGKVDQSLRLAQRYYDPLLREDLRNDRVHRAVVAADTTLLLAGELQQMWCPDAGKVEQLQLQAREMEKLIREAGVTAGGQ